MLADVIFAEDVEPGTVVGSLSFTRGKPPAVDPKAAFKPKFLGELGVQVAQLELGPSIVPEAAQEYTPSKYILQMQPAAPGRVLSVSTQGVSFDGLSSCTANIVPRADDPAYAAFTRRRAQASAAKAAAEPKTLAFTLRELHKVKEEATARGSASLAQEVVEVVVPGEFDDIYSLFEVGAYWSRAQIRKAVPSLSDPEFALQVRELCDFVRSGPHHNKYMLKPERRTTRSAPLDEDEVADASDSEEDME